MPEIKILLVDDEETLLEVSKVYLEKMNEKFNIITVDSAVEALEMIKQQDYDVIISDYQMPVINGLEFLSQVRNAGNEIPFIIFTGKGREEVAIQALNLGADFYLQKGGETTSQFHELENLIDKLFEKKQADKLRRHLLDQQISINKLALTLGETRDLNKIYKTIFQHIYSIMDADTFVVSFYDKDKQTISPGYALIEGKALDITIFPALPLSHKESEIQSQVISTSDHIYLPDLRRVVKQDPVTNKKTHHEGEYTKSAIFVPMKIGGDTIGVIEVQSYDVNAYTNQDIDLLSALANVAAVAIQNARLFKNQQQTNIELLDEKNRTQTYLDVVDAIIVVLDPSAKVQMINKRGCQILGFDEGDIIGKDWIDDFIPQRLNSRMRQSFTDIMLGGIDPTTNYENLVITKTGKERMISWNSSTIKDSSNRVIGILSSGIDITDQLVTEATILASEKQYETTLNSLGVPLHVIDENLNIVLLNNAFKRWLEELDLNADIISKNIFDTFPFLSEDVREEYTQVISTGRPLSTIETNTLKDRIIITEVRKIPVVENGNVSRVITVIRDITDEKKTEQELREIAEQYSNLFHNSNDAVFLHDLQGNILNVNKRTLEIFGYSKEEILSMNLLDFASNESRESTKTAFKEIEKINSVETEVQMVKKNGERMFGELSASLIKIGGKKLVQGVIRDITTRKTMEDVRLKRINDLLFLSNSAMHFVGQSFSKDIYQYIAEQVKELAGDVYIITASYDKEKEIFNIKSLLGIKDQYKTIAKFIGMDPYKVEAKLNTEYIKRNPFGKLLEVEDDLHEISMGAISKRASKAIYNLLKIDKVYTTTFNKGTQIVGGLLILVKKGHELKNKNLIEAFASQASVAILSNQAQEELQSSEERFRQIIYSTPMGIHVYNMNNNGQLIFQGGNPSADEILKIKHSELIGKAIEEAFPSSVGTDLPKIYKQIALKGGTWSSEQVDYKDDSITGSYEVRVFQTVPGSCVALFQDVTEKKIAKEEEQEFVDNLTFLSQTATDFIGFSSDLDIYKYIAERMKELIGKAIIVVSSFNEQAIDYHVRAVLGLGKNVENVLKFLGRHPVGMIFNVRDKLRKQLTKTGISKVDVDLSQLTQGGFPKQAVKPLRRVLGTGNIYSVAFMRKSRLYGNVLLIMQEGNEIKNPQLVEAFAQQASVALLRRKAEEELLDSEERFRTLIETMNDGLAVDDENGLFSYVNKKLCEMLGYNEMEIIGHKVSEFLDEENRHLYANQSIHRSSGILESYEISWIKKDKTLIPTIISPQPMFDSEGNYMGSFAVITDIAERIQNEKQMREQQEELFKQRDELESFASTIAHDLRGKMQVISLYNSMTESEFSDKIGESIEEMSAFIEDLLLLAKKGELLGEFKTVNLNTMIQDIAEKLYTLEPNMKVEIGKLPKITGDPIKLRQVFENLLMNVYKHAEAFKVEIDAKDYNNFYKIIVKDDGKGIPKDKKDEIIESWTTMRYSSFGMLIILKIVQAHGGELTLESEEGKGTTVIIQLPKNTK
ncbi:MAG: PAS domain S-box protein [Candidatus Heimdallarchaeota archaeon]|nr:PAS domain S-box protein [Candidatus Heimdallarchaeota archaeon]MBY8993945.1 PAS domain S-box protein [Candidatus Heimdallarchaeota archaeon]